MTPASELAFGMNSSISPRMSACNSLTPLPKRTVAFTYAMAELTYERKTGLSCTSQDGDGGFIGRTGTNLLSAVVSVYGTRGRLIGAPLHCDHLVQ